MTIGPSAAPFIGGTSREESGCGVRRRPARCGRRWESRSKATSEICLPRLLCLSNGGGRGLCGRNGRRGRVHLPSASVRIGWRQRRARVIGRLSRTSPLLAAGRGRRATVFSLVKMHCGRSSLFFPPFFAVTKRDVFALRVGATVARGRGRRS